MAQFTLYKNQNEDSKDAYPYFVDVQSNLLESLNSRLVIPLTSYKYLDDSNISNLCPKIVLKDESFVLLTPPDDECASLRAQSPYNFVGASA